MMKDEWIFFDWIFLKRIYLRILGGTYVPPTIVPVVPAGTYLNYCTVLVSRSSVMMMALLLMDDGWKG